MRLLTSYTVLMMTMWYIDARTMNTELALADLEAVERRVFNLTKKAKGGDKDAAAMLDVFKKLSKR